MAQQPSQEGDIRMGIKERVEQHPIIYLLMSAVSVSIIVLSVAEYFCRQRIDIASQKSELRISTLESELTSIRRGMGESNFLDIRTFVYPKDRLALLKVNPKSKFVSEENFYAILDLPGWQYERTSTEKLIRTETGEELPPTAKKVLGKNPVNRWTAAESLAVKGPHGFSESGPDIIVEKVLYTSAVPSNKEDYSKFLKEMTGSEPRPEDLPDRAFLEHLYRGDMATVLLANFFQTFLGEFVESSEISTQLLELEKIANVIYLQDLITVHNATVNGKKLPVYFVRHELIIITDQNGVTFIVITVPSADPMPRGPAYAQIQEWFSGLAIPVG
jgi:hypothetical protein